MIKRGTVIPYLNKIQKIRITWLRDILLDFCWHQDLFTGNQQLSLCQEIEIWIGFQYIILNSLNVLCVFKGFLENVAAILMIPIKLVILGCLKIRVFWKEGYDVIVFGHVITQILSRESNYIADVVRWFKFDSATISMREVIITTFL